MLVRKYQQAVKSAVPTMLSETVVGFDQPVDVMAYKY